ncbi:MAG: ATP-binding protein [Ferruginibacter sp.]
MKIVTLTMLFVFIIASGFAQDTNIDSLKKTLALTKEDTGRVNVYLEISKYYNYKYPDSVLDYGNSGLALARKLNFKKAEIIALNQLGEAWNSKGNYPKALEIKLSALQAAEDLHDPYLVSHCQNFIGALYINTGDYRKALFHYHKAGENETYARDFKKYLLGMIGQCYLYSGLLDSSYNYVNKSYQLDLKDKDHWTNSYYLMARIAYANSDYEKALGFYRMGNDLAKPGALDVLRGYQGIALIFNKLNKKDSAIYYAKKVVGQLDKRPLYSVVIETSSLLTGIYKADKKFDSAFKYQEIMLGAKDSLFNQHNVKQIQSLTFNEQQRLEQLQNARILARQEYKAKIKLYSLIAGLVILTFFALVLYRNNQQKRHSNALLGKKNTEIQTQKNDLEDAITELKAAQAQLIQKEKMASLGELTAGIAHEIQNPLNFVNNFSDINKELLEELKEEAGRGNMDEVKLIAGEVITNEQKINHHGKRADAIVKGMLQHSQKSSGQKEPIDINALADEYLRLAYNGLRAKDKNFNATLKTNFDKLPGKINIVPQDISRVLLNLYHNAFYAVQQKQKEFAGQGLSTFEKLANPYEPQVSVSTKNLGDSVEIKVSDNGGGIPQNIVDKIFQPFFTTKPTGEGTGLGLSLSYDIIRAHGGEISVASRGKAEALPGGQGTTFIITLPEN